MSLQGTVKAIGHGGWEDGGGPIVSFEEDQCSEADTEVTAYAMPMASQISPTSTAMSAQERAQHEALGRHIAIMEAEAEAVIAEKEQWEEHLQRCNDEESKDNAWRKSIFKEYTDQLKQQIQDQEEQRTEGRLHSVIQASEHNFPSFVECPEVAVADFVKERRNNLKDDLDEQVEIKRRLKLAAKQRDRDMEACHLEASTKQMALLKLEAQAKREKERAILAEAWDRDKRLHSLRKSIAEHHKAPGTRAQLQEALQTTLTGAPSSGSAGGAASGAAGVAQQQLSPSQPRQPSLGATMPQLGLGAMSPRGGGSSASDSGPPSSRPITGSVRRMPLGAAGSLALQKERLAASARR